MPRELKRFFEDYKTLEKKQVVVEEFEGPFEANKVLRAGLQMYEPLPAEKKARA